MNPIIKKEKHRMNLFSLGPGASVTIDGMNAGVNAAVKVSVRYDGDEPVGLEVIRRGGEEVWFLTMEPGR